MLDGLFIHPEMMKSRMEFRATNDYLDYNPAHYSKDIIVVEVPAPASNDMDTVIEIKQEKNAVEIETEDDFEDGEPRDEEVIIIAD